MRVASSAGAGLLVVSLFAPLVRAQTGVLTQHNDPARTGANTSETTLTPANVNQTQFGKIFSHAIDGYAYAQPLYLSGVTMGPGTAQAGTTHNVIFVATEHDTVYAFDADSNVGANAQPLWQASMLDPAHGAPAGATTVPSSDVSTADIVPEIGITGTPVIDPATNTIYIDGKTKENGIYPHRLHALDLTTGAEKFGGPVLVTASVPGTGNGSVSGTLTFDSHWANNRPGLLLLNGVVYLGYAAHGDNGPWHGWVIGYNATTLQSTGAWCSTPNGGASGVWMSGAGLAADVPSGSPFGRMFVATGNGSFNAAPPYTNAMNYGDDHVRLDLANGTPVVTDSHTPTNQLALNNGDTDLGSGGVLLLPDQPGSPSHLLVQVGKEGLIYLIDRDNMGGFTDAITQAIPGQVSGHWSMPAYWNSTVYFWGNGDSLKSFSLNNGRLSTTPTAHSADTSGFPGSTPSISANGNSNGIAWTLQTDAYGSQGPTVLKAHDASNVATLLYASNQNAARDGAGGAVKFAVPTVINGRVYVGTETQLNVYGLLNGQQQAASPVFTPGSQSFNGTLQVAISDSTQGAQIFFTTNGATPTPASTPYTGPIAVTTSETVQAIATATNFLQSPVAGATYTLVTQVATPTFTPAPGTYTAAQSVTIATSTTNASIFYTTDGTTPTSASTRYTGPLSIGATTTIKAIGTTSGLTDSPVSTGTYTIDLGGVTSIGLGAGFSPGSMVTNGSAKLNGTRLQLTDAGASEAASAWYPVQANIKTFTTDFTFQISGGSSPTADGMAFVIQANSPTVIGPLGGGLGYGPDTPTGVAPSIGNSVAIKFDLYSNSGEGVNSTGLYTNGQSPTTPFIDLTGSAIDLHSGHLFAVHLAYDGTTLTETITDTVTNGTFTHAYAIGIPATIGGNSAYVGFTAGTGGLTAIQEVATWTYASGGPAALTSISVTPSASTVGAGTTAQLHATGTYSDSSTQDLTATATWTSSNTAVATISSSGLATASAAGQTTISAAASGVSGGTTLTVTPPGVLTIVPLSVNYGTVNVGSSVTLSFTVQNTGGSSLKVTKSKPPPLGQFTALTSLAEGTPLAAGQKLTLSVKFAPTTGGALSDGWILNSDAPGGAVQTVQFSGTGNVQAKITVVADTEKIPAVSSGPVFRTFAFNGFPDGIGTILDATMVSDSVTFTLSVPQPGIYDVKVGVKLYGARGIWQLTANGANVGSAVDEYQNSGGTFAVIDVGLVNIAAAGNQSFKFTVVGKNAASSAYRIAFDAITLTQQ